MIYISSSLVTAETAPLTHARIGYHNITFGKTPFASGAITGHPAIAATYPNTYDYWQPNSVPATWGVDSGANTEVDYCGLAGEFAGATIAIQSSPDNSTWTTRHEVVAGSNIAMLLFQPVVARYWRIVVSGVVPKVSIVYIGKALAMQRAIYQGHSPITLSRNTETQTNTSERGQYLGRSIIRGGTVTSFSWQHLKADWYRANFDQFVKAARTMPFFIAWRPSTFPAEVGFVWTDEDIRPQNTGPRDFMSVSMNVSGIGVD